MKAQRARIPCRHTTEELASCSGGAVGTCPFCAHLSTSQHAERILKAWSAPDRSQLEHELSFALTSCRTEPSALSLEREHQELLEAIAEYWQTSNALTESSLFLLRHLSTSRTVRTAAAGV